MRKSMVILGLLLGSFSSCSLPMVVEEVHEFEELVEFIETQKNS
jgi:hypothetical protein